VLEHERRLVVCQSCPDYATAGGFRWCNTKDDFHTDRWNCPKSKQARFHSRLAIDRSTCEVWELKAPRILICVYACNAYAKRLKVCIDTWITDAARIGQQVLIVRSGPVTKRFGDILMLKVPDTYSTLPQKTRALCQWAITQPDWDYLFKCDDDTYISIPRFVNYRPTADYIGSRTRGKGLLYAHGGAGYFLSRRAAEIVAENVTNLEGWEDHDVGLALANAGIKCKFDARLVGVGNDHARPRHDNDLITTHTKRLQRHYDSHREAGLGSPKVAIVRPPTRRERLKATRQFVGRRRVQPAIAR
jgi:hypothetical protein